MKKLLTIINLLMCMILCNAQTINYPVFDSTYVEKLHINKVEITQDTTYVYCTFSADANSWANISSDTYLLSYPSKTKHKLFSSIGFPIAPEKRNFQYDEKCDVLFCFSSIKGSSHFDFIEVLDEDAFNIFGVNLNDQFEKQFTKLELKRFSNMSSFYDSAGDTTKAIQFKKNEVDASEYIYGNKSYEYYLSLIELAVLYDKYDIFDEAIETMEIATEKREYMGGTSNSNYALQLRALAQFYSHAGMIDKSISTYKKSISLYETLNICDIEYAKALSFISAAFQYSGDDLQSMDYQMKAIDAWKKLGDSEDYLKELETMVLQNDSKARTNFVESELGNLPAFADTTTQTFSSLLKVLTASFINANNYKDALRYCNRNLSLLEKNDNRNQLEIADALAYKCKINRGLNLIQEAIIFGEKAKSLFDSIQVHPLNYCFVLDDLAWCYGILYDYENAILYQKKLVAEYEEKGDWVSLAGALGSLGEHYQHKEDLDKAEEVIRKAIDIISNHNIEQTIKEMVAKKEITAINYSNTLNIAKEHYLIVKNSLQHSLANICFKNGNYNEAIQIMTEINNDALEMGDNELYLSGLSVLSLYYNYNNQFEEAINTAKQSISLISMSNYLDNDKYQKAITLSLAYQQIAMSYYMLKNYQEAINYLEKSIAHSEGVNSIDPQTQSRIIMSIIYWNNKDYSRAELFCSEALDYLQKEITKEIINMKTEQKQRMWSKYDYAFVNYREIVEKGEWDGNIFSKLYNYTLFSKSLLLDSDNAKKEISFNRMMIKWKDIQNKLSNNDIAIEFITTREDSLYNTYHALVIDKTCVFPNMITLYRESDLLRIRQESKDNILSILGTLIWKPILNKYSHISNIYFSPDGLLHVLPIEYCHLYGVGELLDHYNFYRLSSTKEIVFQDKKASKKNAVLYGGLEYDILAKESNNTEEGKYSFLRSINARGGFEPLINTLDEVNGIDSLLESKKVSTNLYTGTEGTEESFRDFHGKDVNMLHFATHGMYVGPSIVEQTRKENNFNFLELITNENDPVKEDIVLTHSFLVMSGGNKLTHRDVVGMGGHDGILTAYEISHIDLSKVDLVVLSACETGLGDLESGGIYGLQRGFKKAGVNTILMSLDKVDDEATKILMVEFYKNLTKGKTKHQSLKDAQKYLRQVENGKYDKPEYWASFIMLDGIN